MEYSVKTNSVNFVKSSLLSSQMEYSVKSNSVNFVQKLAGYIHKSENKYQN